jgi:hydrogenase maturation protein HypF
MVSADISMCEDCRAEMHDVNNRRYRYPFINCTNCGPRYTIINTLPYDRKNTSMQKFTMCEDCKKEYEEPLSRRFHAQPISCHACGPKLFVATPSERKNVQTEEALALCSASLSAGQSIVIKGIGGFHIVCDATNEEAVATLRANKRRPTKPLAVMFKDIQAIKEVCFVSEDEERLLLSKERPIVLVTKKDGANIAPSVAPNIDRIGVFLPYAPLHELLLNALNFPIVATSANLSDAPIITDEKELFAKLSHVLTFALTNDREILNACDDSVVMDVSGAEVMLRLSRGYAPKSFYSRKRSRKKILALGGNQKSTITLAFDNHLILSPHIGDLNSLDAFEYFLRTLQTFKRFYNFEPEVIVCDKHPNYETTKWARAYVAQHPHIELLEVQHHYAHAMACMAEYDLDAEFVAFCFDGTGYGDTQTLWGGEVLLANADGYERLYHLQEFSLLGADKAIKEPRRTALALLFEVYSLETILVMQHPLVASFTEVEIRNYHSMYTKNLNAPRSSSVGRLFDGVYALCGYLDALGYEGESGLILERDAQHATTQECYNYKINGQIIEFSEMLHAMMQEKEPHAMACKFINTLVAIMVDISLQHANKSVILSGGVFQNKVLLQRAKSAFEAKGIKYFIQSQTPINDGGISLGQAYYALNKHHIKDTNG